MSIFPTFENIDVTENTELTENTKFKEPLFDFSTGKTVIKDGNTVMTDKEQHIQQYITLLIRTEVDKFRVYQGTDFGLTDLYEQQGKQIFTTPFAIEEIKRELTEKCILNPNIEFVTNIEVSINFNTVKIEMTVQVEGKELITEVEI